jgi:hypothetical protein
MAFIEENLRLCGRAWGCVVRSPLKCDLAVVTKRRHRQYHSTEQIHGDVNAGDGADLHEAREVRLKNRKKWPQHLLVLRWLALFIRDGISEYFRKSHYSVD